MVKHFLAIAMKCPLVKISRSIIINIILSVGTGIAPREYHRRPFCWNETQTPNPKRLKDLDPCPRHQLEKGQHPHPLAL
jgi:hypothetical protein